MVRPGRIFAILTLLSGPIGICRRLIISGQSQRRIELGQKTATADAHHQVTEFFSVPDIAIVCNDRVMGRPAPQLRNVFQYNVQVDRIGRIDIRK